MTPSLASMRWMVGSDSPDKLRELALVEAGAAPVRLEAAPL